jgi:hypothetical protein
MKARVNWISLQPEHDGVNGVDWWFEILPGIHLHHWGFGGIEVGFCWLFWAVEIQFYDEG